MNISTIIAHLETLAPISLQESYDNSGLIVGNLAAEIDAALLCLDSTEEVIEEAIQLGCNLVIAHHPIVFSGLKSLTGKNYIERTILKAIKNDIAIYAIHTNLDNVSNGVNRKIAEKLKLNDIRILSPKKSKLSKLVFFCPTAQVEKVRKAVFEAGAGTIGEYDFCSFNINGLGTYRAGIEANPFAGEKGEIHQEEEIRVEVIVPSYLEKGVAKALLAVHPYEEVAFDFYELKNDWRDIGSGMIGELEKPIQVGQFLDDLKVQIKTACIRHTDPVNEKIQRVAVCGGSGSFLLNAAIAQKADVFITADYKYHQFFDADGKIMIADVGHFESEQYTPELLHEYINEKIPNFASYLSKVNTNPINYR